MSDPLADALRPAHEDAIRRRHAYWATAIGTFGDHILSHPDEECWADLDRHNLIRALDAARASRDGLRTAARSVDAWFRDVRLGESVMFGPEALARLDALARKAALAPAAPAGHHGDGDDDRHYDPACPRCIAHRDRTMPPHGFDTVYATTEEPR